MTMKMKRYPYFGNITNCYTQALLTSFIKDYDAQYLYSFEMLTTIPFGVVYIENDPNRIIDCYIDPDIGLERALQTLDIPFEIKFWPPGTNGAAAIQNLHQWCTDGLAVLGPLNMDGLNYYFHEEIFRGMDHYIIVTGFMNNKFCICDPEGIFTAYISTDNLLKAWRGDKIREGRGEFMMRRVLNHVSSFEADVNCFEKALLSSINNLEAALKLKNGGPQGLKMIARQYQEIECNPSLRRGLTYAIPTRIERCMLEQYLIQQMRQAKYDRYQNEFARVLSDLEIQLYLYGKILFEIMGKVEGALKTFHEIAELEEKITLRLCNVKQFSGKA